MAHAVKTKKRWEDQSINERIAEIGWFDGDENDWYKIPMKERETLAFNATGCEVAFPTWEPPVDCVHIGCRARRGEVPKICILNHGLNAELTNWLRFHLESKKGRIYLAHLFRGMRAEARRTGIYDPWKLSWQTIVFGGIAAL